MTIKLDPVSVARHFGYLLATDQCLHSIDLMPFASYEQKLQAMVVAQSQQKAELQRELLQAINSETA